jgi:DNA invertase Pin-like site-specific DNA recombinase
MIQLLADAESGASDFDIILVYDVSRWGRYQDTDEGAYHEYRCRKAGKAVEYCAEQFSCEISPLNTVIKAIKRAMAAEYSRELAVRTHSAQVRGASQGFLQGGIAGYGLRRLLIDAKGEPKGLLPCGTAKSFRTDRVVLVPGPPEEIAVVRRIFNLFVTEHVFKKKIAKVLNSEGVPFTNGRKWNENHIRFLLSNERATRGLWFSAKRHRYFDWERVTAGSRARREQPYVEALVMNQSFRKIRSRLPTNRNSKRVAGIAMKPC